MFKVKRLIWAVDPFSDLEASDEKCLAFLNALNGSQPGTVEIEPVYVITPLQVTELAVATQEFKVSAEKRLETRFKKINLPGVLPYKIIKQKGVSIRERVHTLLDYAKETHTSAILVTSHARKGLLRSLMGSFAETLTSQTQVPVAVVNPHRDTPRPIKNILFPTDLSDASKEAYSSVLEFAKQQNAKLTLFHSLGEFAYFPIELAPDIGRFVKARQAEIKEWQETAKAAGVETTAILEEHGATAQAVTEYASKNSTDLIIMVSQRGPVLAALGGSVTRNVLRESPVPVWVTHTGSH